jgi:DNA modification methylase
MGINLMQGDCLELMGQIPGGSTDLVLTDPPYKISNSSGGMMDKDNRDFIRQIDKLGMCNSCFAVVDFLHSLKTLFKTKNHYNLVSFCSRLQLNDYLNFAIDNKLQYGVMVWHKTDPAPLCNNKYLNDIEFIVYIKGNKARIRGNYSSKSLVYTSPTNRADKKNFKHPTIKPLKLLEKFLVNHTSDVDTVFDPFMGSGSTGVACKNLGRNFIGIEQDEEYFKIAEKRIKEA